MKKKRTKQLEKFSEFQLVEYQNIAAAHFEVQKQLSVFFRYYILVISAPILILTILKSGEGASLETLISSNKLVFVIVFLFLGTCGFFFGQYMVSLKNEQALYARTVNNIRKFFYLIHAEDGWYQKFGLLPLSDQKPKYSQTFQPLILIVKILNSAFLALAVFLIVNLTLSCNILISTSIFIFSIAVHHLVYERTATRMELKWHNRDLEEEYKNALKN